MSDSDLKAAMGGNEYRLPIPTLTDLGDGRMTANDMHDVYCRLYDMGRKRTVKTELFAEVIRDYDPVDAYVLFRQFTDVFPHPDRALGIANHLIDEAVANVYFGGDKDHVTSLRDEHGGLSEYLKDNEKELEPTEWDNPLVTELREVQSDLEGMGAEQEIVATIEDTLTRLEHPWVFTQMIGRDVAFYVGNYMFLDAITEHCGFPNDTLKDAWEVTADAPTVFLDWALDDRELQTRLTPHSMCSVMKAKYDYEPSDIPELQASGNWVAQTKYDGTRVFIHHDGDGDYRVYLGGGQKDVTAVMPEIEDLNLPECAFIFDGEATPYDTETGEVLPFQNILRRISRHPDEGEFDASDTDDLEVRFKFFDCLVWHGEDIRDRRFEDRFQVVRNVFAPPYVAATGSDLEAAFHRSIEEGHEGLVMKHVDHEYQLGDRSSDWQKWKAQPEELDVVVTDANRGGGRISDGIGALRIAVEHDGELVNVGSVGTGFTDDERRKLWREWEAGTLEGQVIQVTYEELQTGAGDSDDVDTAWALRFPSYDHKRPDGEVDSLERAAALDNKEEEFAEWVESRTEAVTGSGL